MINKILVDKENVKIYKVGSNKPYVINKDDFTIVKRAISKSHQFFMDDTNEVITIGKR